MPNSSRGSAPSSVTGRDLALLRFAHRLTAAEVARRMGVSKTRVRAIESQRLITPAVLRRYFAAVEGTGQ